MNTLAIAAVVLGVIGIVGNCLTENFTAAVWAFAATIWAFNAYSA